MAQLKTFVAVRDDDGTVHSFGPGAEVPAWASKKITNPAAWEDGTVPEQAAGADTTSGQSGGSSPEPPPKGGKGSGLDDWLAYAAHFPQVPLPEDPSRDDVIDALDEAGVRTE